MTDSFYQTGSVETPVWHLRALRGRRSHPIVYGAELAFWVSRQLAQRGTLTSYPQYEDWGWFIEYNTEDDHEYWLCCANRDGAQDKWRCYLEPKAKSLFGRNKAPVEGARPLIDALRNALAEEPSISNVNWRNQN